MNKTLMQKFCAVCGHDWCHYFSGWICTRCGKKSGHDYKYGKPRKHKF